MAARLKKQRRGLAARERVAKDRPKRAARTAPLANGLDDLFEGAVPAVSSEPSGGSEDEEGDSAPQRPIAETLIAIGGEAELFHTPEQDPCITIGLPDRANTMRIAGKEFADWLRRELWVRERRSANSAALEEARGVLSTRALFESPQRPTSIRVAGHESVTYIDLANTDRDLVEVSAGGWRIVHEAPVRFRRPPGMKPLPVPARGRLDDLRAFVNLDPKDNDGWQLLVAWLCAALCPRGPYAILAIEGEQGAAKSTFARVIRALVDPNFAPLRSKSRSERDLMISAQNSWVFTLDNLSSLTADESDMLCRLATGGGLAVRKLYSDAGETLFDAARPILLTSVASVISRSDLADRSVVLSLPPVTDARRQDESSFWSEFNTQLPSIFGGLLTTLARATSLLPGVGLGNLPRMADFARFGVAAERALQWPRGSFLKAYNANRRDALRVIVDADLVARGVRALLAAEPEWDGTSSELHKVLPNFVPEWSQSKYAPTDPVRLGARLRHVTPALRNVGIEVEYSRSAGARIIHLRKVRRSAVTAVTTVIEQQEDATDTEKGRKRSRNPRITIREPGSTGERP